MEYPHGVWHLNLCLSQHRVEISAGAADTTKGLHKAQNNQRAALQPKPFFCEAKHGMRQTDRRRESFRQPDKIRPASRRVWSVIFHTRRHLQAFIKADILCFLSKVRIKGFFS